jgi:hypothetical protein
LQKCKSPTFNISKKELKGVKSLWLNKAIRILLAQKDKINTLLNSGVYEHLFKDPTAKIERNVQLILAKYKAVLPAEVKRKLTAYNSKPPHLYGLPKIQKPDMQLIPVVSSISSPSKTCPITL